jgi:tetratricopeptide (TPR) repeat protein/DNA-binding MarR family transcriptional regulator
MGGAGRGGGLSHPVRLGEGTDRPGVGAGGVTVAPRPAAYGGRAAPEDLVLLHLAEAEAEGVVPTQRRLAGELRASQPSVSRSLARLEAAQMIRVHAVSLRSPGIGERAYSLTPSGERHAKEIRRSLRDLRWTGSEITLGDLEATLNVRRLSLLLEAMQQGLRPEELLARHAPGVEEASTAFVAGAPSAPIVGRFGERLRLVRSLRLLRSPDSRGEVLVLVGPAGAGKSRLLRFAEEFARDNGIRVLVGRPLSGPRLLFSPYEEMLGSRPTAHSGASSERPGTETQGPADPLLTRARGRAGSRAARLLRYLDRIESMAREGPLLVLVDDLERSAPSSLQVFEFLGTNLPRLEVPVLLLAASREEGTPAGLSPRFPVARVVELLDRFQRSGLPRLDVLRLGPLSTGEARALLHAALGPDQPPAGSAPVLRSVLERARGNPFFLLEGVREVKDRGWLAPNDRAGKGARALWRGLAVSPSVRRLVASRLSGLPAAHRTLLEMAACLGEEFDTAPLEALAAARGDRRPGTVARRLEELTTHWQLLRPAGPARYAFAHVLYQEVLQEGSPSRHRWSKLLAEWWERERPHETLTIARLYHAAQDAERGLPWIDRAIAEVVDRQAYASAELYVRAAHELLASNPRDRAARIPADLALADRLWSLGATRSSQGVLEVVLDTPLPRALRWEAEAALLNALAVTDPVVARERFEALRNEVRRSGVRAPDRLAGQLAAVEAFLHLQAGEWDQCLELAELALRRLGRSDDWIWTSWARLSRSTALLSLGRWFEAMDACREDRARYQEETHTTMLALLDNIEGRVQMILGEPERAWRCFDVGFRLASRIGSATVMASLLANRAAAEVAKGDVPAARSSVDALVDLAMKFDLTVHGAWAQYRRAQVLWAEGRVAEADRAFDAARIGFERLGLAGPGLLPQVYRAVREIRSGHRRAGEEALRGLQASLGIADADERALLPPEAAEAGARGADGPRGRARGSVVTPGGKAGSVRGSAEPAAAHAGARFGTG